MISILERSELFGGLSASYLEKVSNLCRSESYRQNMMIFKEGDEATELYMLTDGRVALEIDIRPVADRPAIPTALEVCTKGEPIGWSALVAPYIYTMSARCITNCTVLALKGDLFRKVMDDDVGLGYELMKRLSQVISLRLTNARLRITSGLGLALLGTELGLSE
jgi:CRP-like cAMP-binding protein